MDQTLDCKNLCCPIPIVRISQKMRSMAAGEILRVEATDPAFRPDLEAWVRRLGHRLVAFHEGSVQLAVIEKGDKGEPRRAKRS